MMWVGKPVVDFEINNIALAQTSLHNVSFVYRSFDA